MGGRGEALAWRARSTATPTFVIGGRLFEGYRTAAEFGGGAGQVALP